MGLGEIWIQQYGLLAGGDYRVELLLIPQCSSQIDEKVRGGRIDGNGPVYQFHRSLVLPLSARDLSQQMERVRMVWLRCKDLTVDRFSVRQSSGLVVLKRDL